MHLSDASGAGGRGYVAGVIEPGDVSPYVDFTRDEWAKLRQNAELTLPVDEPEARLPARRPGLADDDAGRYFRPNPNRFCATFRIWTSSDPSVMR